VWKRWALSEKAAWDERSGDRAPSECALVAIAAQLFQTAVAPIADDDVVEKLGAEEFVCR
jgi:hypothetical protein